MSPILVQSRWRGRVLRSWALSPSPPNICKPLLVSPFPPPVVTTSALSIEESEEGAIARRGKSGTNGRRTDGRTDGRTCAKAVSRRCSFQRGLSSVLVRAQRKKTSQRKQKETTASSSEYVRFQRELLFFEDLPLSVFFFFRVHYILANRKNENVSDNNSFCNDPRARDVLQSLSRSFYAIIPRSRLF